MKKILIIFTILSLFLGYSGICFGQIPGKINYDRMYEDMPILDYMYETGIDREEPKDYEEYFISPYVLIRLPVKLRNQKVVLNPGYYLVKPEKKDGYNFTIFKQNGHVVGVIPVYKKYLVDPNAIFLRPQQQISKKKHKWYTKPFRMAWSTIKWPFKKIFKQRNLKTPPHAKVEFELIDDKYYDLGLYVENSLYKMLFKLEN